MTGYHVTTYHKLERYRATGLILPPVRFWPDIADAARFSRQTGRRIILRIVVSDTAVRPLPGHQGRAYYSRDGVPFREF